MFKPALPRAIYSYPNVQVNRGQPFMIEYSSGHPGTYHYFVVLAAENEGMMAQHTEKLLDEYIAEAPWSAGERYRNEFWDKYHVGWADPKSYGASTSNMNFVMQGKTTVEKGDKDYIERPWAFACSGLGNRYGYSSWTAQPISEKCIPYLAPDLKIWRYPKSELKQDIRIAYTNPKFPWIEAVWRIRGYWHHPHQVDLFRIEIPKSGTGIGPYIVHWVWRGYYDAIDVDVLDDKLVVPNESAAIYGRQSPGQLWFKVDHAQFLNGTYRLATHRLSSCLWNRKKRKYYGRKGVETCIAIPPEGKKNTAGQTRNEALEFCKSRCDRWGRGCTSLNVVPIKPPPDVVFSTEQNIPWGVGDCRRKCLNEEPEGSHVCYTLYELPMSQWAISDTNSEKYTASAPPPIDELV